MFQRLKWAEVKYSGVPFLIGSCRAIAPTAAEPQAESQPQPPAGHPHPDSTPAAPEDSR